jgi:hypothetical protein
VQILTQGNQRTLTVVISAFRIANTTAITSRAKRGLVGCEDEEASRAS